MNIPAHGVAGCLATSMVPPFRWTRQLSRNKNKTDTRLRVRLRLVLKNRYWIVTGQGPPFGLDMVAEPNPAPPSTTPVIFADFFLSFGFLTSSPHS